MADRPQADKWAQQITRDYNLQPFTTTYNLSPITTDYNLHPIESITYAYTIQITLTKTYTVGPTAYNLLPNQNLM